MATPIEDLVKRASSEGIEALLFAVLSPPEQAFIRRAALVRWFDKNLAEEVLDDDKAGFEKLTQTSLVERAPRGEGRYQLRPNLRRQQLRGWLGEDGAPSPEMRALSAKLAHFFAERAKLDPSADLDAIYHTLITDPDGARARLDALYQEADERFDMARCWDIIDVLEDQPALLTGELRDLSCQLRAYFDARSQWADDYYRTARYLDRVTLRKKADDLLQSTDVWIHQINAKGGMGKTMFIRWLTSRYLVPKRIPCARVDFDCVGVAEAERQPWRMILHLAEQLNPQLAGAPFRELLSELGELERARARDDGPDDPTRDDSPTRFVVERFGRALGQVVGLNPIVFILDTTEEALIHHKGDIPVLLQGFRKLREACPGFRVILAGRYNLFETFKSLAGELDGLAAPLDIEPFSEEEARAYLLEKGCVDPAKPIAAAIEKAEGFPFKLALFVELLSGDSTVTEETIRSYASADLAYLIERVVERLPKPLQWVLRYGVVPRTLDRGFVVNVMAPYLRAAMSGKPEGDNRLHRLEGVRRRDDIFPTDILGSKDDALDLDRLWQDLARYASSASWVSSGPERNTLQFHNEVREPMRDLLRGQDIYELLNRDAAAHYERLAKAEPESFGPLMRKAVYHRFQLEGEAAGEAWQALLESEEVAWRPDWRKELALEVLGSEYLDDMGRPRMRRDGRAMVSLATLARAHREIARAGAGSAGTIELEWADIEGALERAQSLEAELKEPAPPTLTSILVDAAALTRSGGSEAAATKLEEALQQTWSDRDRAVLHLEHASALSGLYDPRAVASYAEALRLAQQAKAPAEIVLSIGTRLGEELLAWDRAGEAAAMLEGLTAGHDDMWFVSSHDFIKLVRLRAEANIRNGDPGRALALVLRPGDDIVSLAAVQARAHVALLEPVKALSCLAKVSVEALGSARRFDVLAELAEARGAAAAELMDISLAMEELDRARSLWSEVGNLGAAHRCLLRCIEVDLWSAGNLLEAERLIQEAEGLRYPARREEVVRTRVLRADLFAQKGDSEAARRILRALAERNDLAPRLRVEIALAQVALEQDASAPAWERLAGALDDVPSIPARLHLLEPIRRYERLPVPPPELAERIAAPLVKSLDSAPVKYYAALCLKVANVCAAVGFGERELIQRILADIPSSLWPVKVWLSHLRLAPERLGFERPRLISISPDDFDYWKGYPQLAAAALTLHAEDMLRRGAPTGEVEQIVETATITTMGVGSFETLWSARLQLVSQHLNAVRGKHEQAQEHGRLALLTLEALGHRAEKVDSLKLSIGFSASEPEAPVRPIGGYKSLAGVVDAQAGPGPRRRPAMVLRVSDAPDDHAVDIIAQIEGPGGVLLHKRWTSETSPFADTGMGHAPIVRYARSLIDRADWRSLAHEMASFLGLSEVLAHRTHVTADFQLDVEQRALRGLPWELVSDIELIDVAKEGLFFRTTPSSVNKDELRLRFAQSALDRLGHTRRIFTGAADIRPTAILADFQEAHGLRPTGFPDGETCLHIRRELRRLEGGLAWDRAALIIRPRPERGRDFGARFEKSADVDYYYDRSGIPCTSAELASTQSIYNAILRFAPDIVHISSTFKRAARGAVTLDFGSEHRGASRALSDVSSNLSAADLARAIEGALPFGAPWPLILLDGPLVPVESEMLDQILLRNTFAAELFLFNNRGAPTVLATALDERSLPRLIRNLGEGRTPRELCMDLRGAESPTTLLEALATTATALFTTDPDAPILLPELLNKNEAPR